MAQVKLSPASRRSHVKALVRWNKAVAVNPAADKVCRYLDCKKPGSWLHRGVRSDDNSFVKRLSCDKHRRQVRVYSLPALKDPQANRVYSAEEHFTLVLDYQTNGQHMLCSYFRKTAEVQAFVNECVGSVWWRRNFPETPVKVAVQNLPRAEAIMKAPRRSIVPILADCDNTYDAAKIRVNMPVAHSTILHELAHLAVGEEHQEGHGPRFVDATLAIVGHFCQDKALKARMLASYKEMGVVFGSDDE